MTTLTYRQLQQSLKNAKAFGFVDAKFKLNQKFNIFDHALNELSLKFGVPKDKFLNLNADKENYGTFESEMKEIEKVYEGKPDKKLKLSVKSAFTGTTVLEKIFNNVYHFKYWKEQTDIHEENFTIKKDSYGYSEDRDDLFLTHDKNNGVFSIVRATLSVVRGGCSKNNRSDDLKFKKGTYYEMKTYSPVSANNNCGIACINKILEINLKGVGTRKKYGIEKNVMITPEEMMKIYNGENNTEKKLKIITYDVDDIDEDEYNYILLDDEHYKVITEIQPLGKRKNQFGRNKKITHVRRGLLTWDLETRNNYDDLYNVCIDGVRTLCPALKDTLCCVKYRPVQKEEICEKTFITNSHASSVRQFLDFLIDEKNEGRTYECIAHNGSRFDMYFLIEQLKDVELTQSNIQLRGTSIISLELYDHVFKDSCCFLTSSLNDLCKDFQIEDAKIVEMDIHGEKITNTELCFYKPQLNVNEFLQLQYTDREYWVEYEKYCIMDCLSLFKIWEMFNDNVDTMIRDISPKLLKKCRIRGSNTLTIGSFSKKLLEETNKMFNKDGVADMKRFTNTENKYEFLQKFKRGGVSHCHQPGKHTEQTVGSDIKSQYPASMMYMKVPVGKSKFTTHMKEGEYGFYHLKNCKFSSKETLKPVCELYDNGVLNWKTGKEIEELYIDTWMIEYLKAHYGLYDYEVENALVSKKYVSGKSLFGYTIKTIYGKKQEQDDYKVHDKEKYNPALRSTYKLFMNSLSGKLVEDPRRFASIEWDSGEKDENKNNINGCQINKMKNEKINEWITTGIMTYSMSKRILFDFIHCLPNNDCVIHIETDGVYFPFRYLEEYKNNIYEKSKLKTSPRYMDIGDELGMMEIDPESVGDSYWLGKKFYTYTDVKSNKPTYKIKGIPLKTIDDRGRKVELVNLEMYKKIYEGEEQKRTFKTLKKELYGNTTIIATEITRTIKPLMAYKEYN